MLGVVLAGGEGLRLKPLVKRVPKALVKLAGRPLYKYTLEELAAAGLRRRLVVAPPGRGSLFVEAERVVEQAERGSLTSAVRVAQKEADRFDASTIVIAFAGFLSAPLGMAESVLEYFSTSGFQAVASAVPVITGLETYGFMDLRPTGEVRDVRAPGDPSGDVRGGYVFGGVIALTRKVLAILSERGFYQGLRALSREGSLGAIVWHGDWVEIGYPWDFLEASRVALQLVQPIVDPTADIGRGVILEGRVAVAREAKVKPGAIIEGPAYIGRGAIVGPNSYVTGSVLEAETVSGCCAEVADSVILEGASLGSYVKLEKSVVGLSARVESYFSAEAGTPEALPSRLAGLEKILRRSPAVGVVIGEDSRAPSRGTGKPGGVIG